jgi:hypothetical protein
MPEVQLRFLPDGREAHVAVLSVIAVYNERVVVLCCKAGSKVIVFRTRQGVVCVARRGRVICGGLFPDGKVDGLVELVKVAGNVVYAVARCGELGVLLDVGCAVEVELVVEGWREDASEAGDDFFPGDHGS